MFYYSKQVNFYFQGRREKAMAEENEIKEEKKKKPAAAGGASPVVTLLLIINMIATGSIAFLQYSFMKKEAEKPSLTVLLDQAKKKNGSEEAKEELVEKKVETGIVYPLKGFTVNLAQGDGPRRFVRLNAVLKFSDTSKKDEVDARKPQIRDSIISILNSKRPKDLLKKEGKAYLKEEIKSSINSFLVDGEVIDIFYVGFQIN
jgi:flagellar FliL protein